MMTQEESKDKRLLRQQNGLKYRHIEKNGKGWSQHDSGDPSHVSNKDTLPGEPLGWLKEAVLSQHKKVTNQNLTK